VPASPKKAQKPRLSVRNARMDDVDGIVALSRKIYKGEMATTPETVRGQINNFPEGQFVAELGDQIVGHAATFIIDGSIALKPHSWAEITGNGFASRHDPNGDYLYGMEVAVDPDARRLRIGQRLYNARRDLCQYWELKGVVVGGRLPGYGRIKSKVNSVEEYLELVQEKKIRDQVVGFQLANDFEIIGVLKNYLPEDRQSRGNASHMLWRNPLVTEAEKASSGQPMGRLPESVRVATVQFQMRPTADVDQFEEQVEYFVDVASDYRSDFVVFPELFTLQLLAAETKSLTPIQAVEKVAEYTDRFRDFMSALAVRYNVNIVGGSHPTQQDDESIRNTGYVFLRDGAVYTQDKLHPTPAERYWWNIKGGERLEAVNTDCGPIGVLVCYDCEFPEVARNLVDQGALILFVPFSTDERRGYLRVRYCCQARAVENQCYVVMSGVVGNLPHVENMDIHYAESCVLTPCDFPFARDGVAADSGANTEMIAFADLRFADLFVSRNQGTVQQLKDRRFDLYRIGWQRSRRRRAG
jgi:predicted amidohydrolase/GNAT superfamily N-acetyltransferase